MTPEEILRAALQEIIERSAADSQIAWIASDALQAAGLRGRHVPERTDHVMGATTSDDRGRW